MPEEQEAVIGSSFILAASLALLALADDPHGGEALRHLLSGQILFVSWSDIASFLPVYGLVALAWACIPRLRSGTGFFVLFALAITASVQLVGVYVVFASLILPALAARGRQGYSLRKAFASGGAAVVLGIAVSSVADLPAGPFLVVCFAASAVMGPPAVLDRQRGLPDAARMNAGTGAVAAANSSPPDRCSARFRRP